MSKSIGVIDIGGTNIKYCTIDSDQRKVAKSAKTPKQESEFNYLIEEIFGELSNNDVKEIVIGIPGLVDYARNKIIYCPNLDHLKDHKLKELSEKNDLDIYLANDADLFFYGVTKGDFRVNTLALTIGTGLGGAFCTGSVASDKMGLAGEIGHMKIIQKGRVCGCGQRGCAEAYVSAGAIVQQAKERIDQNIENAKQVFDLSNQGNEIAKEIIDEMSESLGVVIANMINICAIEKVVIGGAVSLSADEFMKLTKETVFENTYCGKYRKIEISTVEDTDQTVANGAQIYFKKNYDRA